MRVWVKTSAYSHIASTKYTPGTDLSCASDHFRKLHSRSNLLLWSRMFILNVLRDPHNFTWCGMTWHKPWELEETSGIKELWQSWVHLLNPQLMVPLHHCALFPSEVYFRWLFGGERSTFPTGYATRDPCASRCIHTFHILRNMLSTKFWLLQLHPKFQKASYWKNERLVDLMNYYMVSLQAQVDGQWSRFRLRETT